MDEWNCNICKEYQSGIACTYCDDGSEFERMSQADRIRAMTDEELAEFLNEITDLCNTEEGCKHCPIKLNKNGFCDIKEWLKSEVKE